MSLSEHVAEVERQIAARLSAAVDEMQRAILARSEKARTELVADLDSFRSGLPERWIEPSELSRWDVPSREETRAELSRSLKATLLAFDGASSQREILEALLEGTRGAADRAAIWLTRDGGLTGWGSVGFGDDGASDPIAGTEISAEASPGLARLIQGRGSIRLSSSDAAQLASELETSTPHSAALVPIVLRDRLAAALYVDRATSDVELDLAQVLAQSAAHRLELQALSVRSYTPTLVLEEEAPAGSAGLPLWDPTAVGEEIAAAEIGVADVVAPPAAAEAADSSTGEVWFEPEPVIESGFELASGFEQEADTLAEPMPTRLDRAAVESEPSAAVEAVEEGAESLESTAASAEIAWELEEAESTVLMEPERPLVEDAAATGEIPLSRPHEKEPAGVEPPEESTAPFSAPLVSPQATQAIRVGGIATHEFPAPSPGDLAEEIAEDATVLIPRATMATPTPPAPTVAPPPPPVVEAPATTEAVDDEPTISRAGGAKTTEVVPPPDLQGPGWAFTASRAARSTGENALHEEARRLARLLVSEIKLYNEEQVDEGRRNRDIYHRLKEDIDRSRQIYEERIHESVRGTTDYFQQELVRSLAGGDARALGI
ncbi:MAG: GAF domain-containing protein [Thermoanaerobaculia bacterium]